MAAVYRADVDVVVLKQSHANQRQAFGFLHAHCTELILPNDCRFVSFKDTQVTITKFDIDGANLFQIQVPDRVCRKRQFIGESCINCDTCAHHFIIFTENVHEHRCAQGFTQSNYLTSNHLRLNQCVG